MRTWQISVYLITWVSLVKWFGPSDLRSYHVKHGCRRFSPKFCTSKVDYPPMGGDANGIEEEEANKLFFQVLAAWRV